MMKGNVCCNTFMLSRYCVSKLRFLSGNRAAWCFGDILVATKLKSHVAVVCNALMKNGSSNDAAADVTNEIKNVHTIDSNGFTDASNCKESTSKYPYIPLFIQLPANVSANHFNKLPKKCESCGAFLQTENAKSKGYILPKKLSQLLTVTKMYEELICANCYSLKTSNKALTVGVDKDNVIWQLKHLSKTKAFVIYVIDVMDIAGSFLPEISHIIGKHQDVIIVGNKADMLATDRRARQQEENITKIIQNHCITLGLDRKNIKAVILMSGITGYGVEKLIVNINKHRDVEKDIYIVGCTNVGKSTIFNLLQNLSAISKDTKLPTQAITHYLPGSTFGLVRHPIAYWRMMKIRKMLLEKPVVMTDDQDTGFEFVDDVIEEISPEKLQQSKSHLQYKEIAERGNTSDTIDFVDLHSIEKKKRWLYDTPGLINPEQVTQFLAPLELKMLKQKLWVVPKTFILRPGGCILFGGLARIDFCGVKRMSLNDPCQEDELRKGAQSVYFTIFCSQNLSLHPTSIEKAPSILEKHLFGNDLINIPFGDKERQSQFPELEPEDHEVTGVGWHMSCADLCIAGLGWISITAGKGTIVHIKLHTPNQIGQHLRPEGIMPYSVTKRGQRGVRYHGIINKRIYNNTRKDNPQLLSFFDKHNEITQAWIKKIKDELGYQRFEKRKERQKLLLEHGVKGEKRKLIETVKIFDNVVAEKKHIT